MLTYNFEGGTKTMLQVEARNLKHEHRCKTYREHESLIPALSSAKGSMDYYMKAAIMKKYLKQLLYKEITMADAQAGIEKQFLEDLHYRTPETAKAQAREAIRVIARYVYCEDRKPLPTLPGVMHVQPFGLLDVTVKPDFVFKGYREFERYTFNAKGKKEKYMSLEPYIEVVKIGCSKPNLTTRGTTRDKSALTSLEMYAMLQCAKQVVKPEDGYINIGASYYFLRKNDDSDYQGSFKTDFWDTKGSGNVVTLWDKYSIAYGNSYMSETDTLYYPQYLSFLQEGEDVCGTDACEHCEFQKLCGYTMPPAVMKKEMTKKALGNIALTDAQKKIVAFREGCAVTNACAGSGKTTVTALNVAFMLADGIPGRDIIVISFGETSVKEFRNRIALYSEDFDVADEAKKVTITTFHALGYSILKKEYARFGFSEEPILVDDVRRARIIAGLLADTVVEGLDYKNFDSSMKFCQGALSVAQKAFSVIKECRYGMGDGEKLKEKLDEADNGYTIGFTDKTANQLLDLYMEYDAKLKEECLIEYSDMEILVLDLLDQNPYYMEDAFHFAHIIVDEFQDTNAPQFAILKALKDTCWFKSLLVVGDDSQSIFGFRGTTPEFIIRFADKIQAEVENLDLLENHRCSGSIVAFANYTNSLIRERVEKDMVATRDPGKPVSVEAFWDKKEKENYVLRIIEGKVKEGVPYEDIAYIAQSRSELTRMASLCAEHGIPTILLNPETMIENSRVSAALSLCQFLSDADDTQGAFEYLNASHKNEWMGKETDEEIKKELASLSSTRETLQALPDAAKLGALKGMLSKLQEQEDEIYDAFLEILLGNNTYDGVLEYARDFMVYGQGQAKKRVMDYPGVVLTTAHSSKGMEWPIVINDISKYVKKALTREEMDAQRRLLFVSATRARDELYVIGDVIAYGKKGTAKERDTRVENELLVDSLKFAGKTVPPEPEKKKNTKVA